MNLTDLPRSRSDSVVGDGLTHITVLAHPATAELGDDSNKAEKEKET